MKAFCLTSVKTTLDILPEAYIYTPGRRTAVNTPARWTVARAGGHQQYWSHVNLCIFV